MVLDSPHLGKPNVETGVFSLQPQTHFDKVTRSQEFRGREWELDSDTFNTQPSASIWRSTRIRTQSIVVVGVAEQACCFPIAIG